MNGRSERNWWKLIVDECIELQKIQMFFVSEHIICVYLNNACVLSYTWTRNTDGRQMKVNTYIKLQRRLQHLQQFLRQFWRDEHHLSTRYLGVLVMVVENLLLVLSQVEMWWLWRSRLFILSPDWSDLVSSDLDRSGLGLFWYSQMWNFRF